MDTHLTGADFRMAQLQGTVFVGTHLDGADFQDTALPRTAFVEVLLQNANLRFARLEGTRFSEVQLAGANLSWVNARDTDLSATRLRNANLHGAHLEGASLRRVPLEGANLSRAELQNALLSGARLQAANLEGAQLQGADVSGAQLQGAYLQVANLRGADLAGAQLQGANLSYANLRAANLTGARLQGADLSSADFTNANLQDAALYASSPVHLGQVDARGLKWAPLSIEETQSLRENEPGFAWPNKDGQTRYDTALERATHRGMAPREVDSCLRSADTQVVCRESLSVEQFRESLLAELELLACTAPDAARGVLRRYLASLSNREKPALKGLARRLQSTITGTGKDWPCPGLAQLPQGIKKLLSELAGKEEGQPEGRSKENLPSPGAPKREG
jgi:uncharacterized protein YjbI with pentapeptide repeats